jgi:hypothetical protein
MATTLQTITNPDRTTTYAMLVIFTVDANSHENLHDQKRMRDEAQSWLESLNASVKGVNVRKAD